MKHASKLLAAFSLLSVAALPSQADTAYTDPVMAASTTLGEGYSVLGITALNPIEATGVIDSIGTVDENGFTTLTVSNVPSEWGTYNYDDRGWFVQFNTQGIPLYYVEITSSGLAEADGKEGQILDIVATSSGAEVTLTVGADLSGMTDLYEGASFAIRAKHTIASVFGAHNEVGLLSGPDYQEADIIYTVLGGDLVVLYYQYADGVSEDLIGWRQQANYYDDMGDTCIDPDFGLVVFRRSGGQPVDLITSGDVKLGTARSVISQGFNPLSMKFPVGMTLAETHLYVEGDTVLESGSDYTNADLVYILENGDFNVYYYQYADGASEDLIGWRRQASYFDDMSDLEIPSGAMIMVFRRSEVSVEWVKEQPFSL